VAETSNPPDPDNRPGWRRRFAYPPRSARSAGREGDGFRASVKRRHYATSFVTAGMWARHCISG
jgi:hypothetical protein